MHCCWTFPRKHAKSLQRRPSLAFGFRTFAHARDQASSPHDGLRKENPIPCPHIWFDQRRYEKLAIIKKNCENSTFFSFGYARKVHNAQCVSGGGTMTYRHYRHGISNRYNRGIETSKASLPTLSPALSLHIANLNRP